MIIQIICCIFAFLFLVVDWFIGGLVIESAIKTKQTIGYYIGFPTIITSTLIAYGLVKFALLVG